MAFVKGDPNINRKGRPKNAEPELLREALRRQGEKRGIDFWEKVAEYAFTDKNVMIAIIKKFVPDITFNEMEAHVIVNQMPTIEIDGKPLGLNLGD